MLWLLVTPLVLATLAGLVLLRPTEEVGLAPSVLGPVADLERATVVDVRRRPLPRDGSDR